MRKEFGLMVRKHMEKRRIDEEALAKRLKISIGYVKHLEYEGIAASFSDGLMTRVIKVLGLPPRKAQELAAAHNRRVTRYRKGLKAA